MSNREDDPVCCLSVRSFCAWVSISCVFMFMRVCGVRGSWPRGVEHAVGIQKAELERSEVCAKLLHWFVCDFFLNCFLICYTADKEVFEDDNTLLGFPNLIKYTVLNLSFFIFNFALFYWFCCNRYIIFSTILVDTELSSPIHASKSWSNKVSTHCYPRSYWI